MGLKERAVFSLLAGLLFLQFFSTTRANFYTQTLDSAFMAEMVDTTFQFGYPRTRLTNSTIVALKTFPLPAEQVCALPLGREPREYMSEFEKHSFLVFYLTFPFRLLFDSKTIVIFLHTFAFAAFLPWRTSCCENSVFPSFTHWRWYFWYPRTPPGRARPWDNSISISGFFRCACYTCSCFTTASRAESSGPLRS